MSDGLVGIREGIEGFRPIDDPGPDREPLEPEPLAVPNQRRRSRSVDLEDEAGPRTHIASLVGAGSGLALRELGASGPGTALRMSNTIFTAPRRPGRGGVRDGVFVTFQGVARRDKTIETSLPHELQGELEGRPWPSGSVLTPVSVGAAELDLALPEGGQVHSHHAWHADEHDPATGSHDLEALLQGCRGAHAVDDEVDASGQTLDVAIAGLQSERTRQPAGGSLVLARLDDLVGAEIAGELSLLGMLGDRDEGARETQGPHRRDHAQAQGSGAEHHRPAPRRLSWEAKAA